MIGNNRRFDEKNFTLLGHKKGHQALRHRHVERDPSHGDGGGGVGGQPGRGRGGGRGGCGRGGGRGRGGGGAGGLRSGGRGWGRAALSDGGRAGAEGAGLPAAGALLRLLPAGGEGEEVAAAAATEVK